MGENALEVLQREHDDLSGLFVQVYDPHGNRSRAWHSVVGQVTTHVAVENSFVHPLLRRRLHLDALDHDLHRDYKQMERILVLAERRKFNSPDMPALVGRLFDAFEEHKERSRTELIPAVRDALSDEELDELGCRMAAAERVILSHPHPHLLELGPVYRWTTQLASAWDRTRDRTVHDH